jgi:hypothetical protein
MVVGCIYFEIQTEFLNAVKTSARLQWVSGMAMCFVVGGQT